MKSRKQIRSISSSSAILSGMSSFWCLGVLISRAQAPSGSGIALVLPPGLLLLSTGRFDGQSVGHRSDSSERHSLRPFVRGQPIHRECTLLGGSAMQDASYFKELLEIAETSILLEDLTPVHELALAIVFLGVGCL